MRTIMYKLVNPVLKTHESLRNCNPDVCDVIHFQMYLVTYIGVIDLAFDEDEIDIDEYQILYETIMNTVERISCDLHHGVVLEDDFIEPFKKLFR